MKTLQELNTGPVAPPFERVFEWADYTITAEYRVGRRGRQGAEIHLLRVWRVLADSAPDRGRFAVGTYASVRAVCNGNGQFTGTVLEYLDTDSITCERCLKRLERM